MHLTKGQRELIGVLAIFTVIFWTVLGWPWTFVLWLALLGLAFGVSLVRLVAEQSPEINLRLRTIFARVPRVRRLLLGS